MVNEYQSTLKSADTEEGIDILFYRPLGYRWALFFRRWGVHPNTVTILSILLGIGAGVMCYFDDLGLNLCGMALLIWANMYDSTDGQLARLTGQKTPMGRILDGFAGDLWFLAIYVAICLRMQAEWGVWIWLLAVVDGVWCHASQCRLADYYRNIHLFFLRGKEHSELDDVEGQKALYRTLSWSRGEGARKLFQYFYIRYVAAQEAATPTFQHLRREMRARYGEGPAPEWLRGRFREGSLPLMKYANFLTFNWRSITLCVALLAGRPWIYLVVEVTLFTAVAAYMRWRHERLCAGLAEEVSRADGADTYEGGARR